MKLFKDVLFVTKYKKLRKLEFKRWITIIAYLAIYFTIEAYASVNDISFAIWDTLLTVTILILVFFFGNFFCEKACFLQRFQDGINVIGRFFFRNKFNNFISQKFRDKIKWLKYILAALTLAVPIIFQSYSVFLKMFGWFLIAGFLLSLIENRAYCKYFCFIGALTKLSSLKNQRRLIRDEEKCTNCFLCSVVCPQDCTPAKDTIINTDLWCTSCKRCQVICPTQAIVSGRNKTS